MIASDRLNFALVSAISTNTNVLPLADPERKRRGEFEQASGSVPEKFGCLFGAGFLGYTGSWSFDKWQGLSNRLFNNIVHCSSILILNGGKIGKFFIFIVSGSQTSTYWYAIRSLLLNISLFYYLLLATELKVRLMAAVDFTFNLDAGGYRHRRGDGG